MDDTMVREMSLGEIPRLSGDQQLSATLIRRDDGTVAVKLVQRGFVAGLGWFDQKTLILEPEQIGPFAEILGRVGRIVEDLPKPAPPKIIPLGVRSAARKATNRPSRSHAEAKIVPFRTRAS